MLKLTLLLSCVLLQAHGTVHGDELAYVFGAPLVGGFSHFTFNFTEDETFLSELMMTMLTNFAKTG